MLVLLLRGPRVVWGAVSGAEKELVLELVRSCPSTDIHLLPQHPPPALDQR